MIDSWASLQQFASQPTDTHGNKDRVLLKLVNGELKAIPEKDMGIKENFLKFLGNFGFGPYYIGDIIDKISKLFDACTNENRVTALNATKVLIGKVDRYNERFLRKHISKTPLEQLISKINTVTTEAAASPVQQPPPQAEPPAPQPSPEQLQATLSAVIERIFDAETTEELDDIKAEVAIYRQEYGNALDEKLLTNIDGALDVKKKFIANEFRDPRVLIEGLRNIAMTMIDEPKKGSAELNAFVKLYPINRTSDPYALIEAHTLATRRTLPEAGETDEEIVNSLFKLIDEIDQAEDLPTLLAIEKRLDALSQEKLTPELEKVPQATCDALFYARGILLEKKPKLQSEPKPFDPTAKGIIAVRGGGACLFRSFAIGLAYNNVPLENSDEAEVTAEKNNPNPDRSHSYLRRQIASYIETHLDDEDITSAILSNAWDYNAQVDRAKDQELMFLPNLHESVRLKAQDYIEKKHNTKIPEAEDIGETHRGYIKRLQHPTFWGGTLELSTLAKVYNVNLQVYNRVKIADEAYVIEKGFHYPDQPLKDRPTICILYNGQDHYDAYVPE